MRYENMKNTIIERARVLSKSARVSLLCGCGIFFAGIYSMVVLIGMGATEGFASDTTGHIAGTWFVFGIFPAISALIIFLIAFLHGRKLERYVAYAESGEYELIAVTMIGFEKVKKSGSISLVYSVAVKDCSGREHIIRIDRSTYDRYRHGRTAYLIDWNNEDKGIIDTYDLYIPG